MARYKSRRRFGRELLISEQSTPSRVCRFCSATKPLSEFPKNRLIARTGGIQRIYACLLCRNNRRRGVYDADVLDNLRLYGASLSPQQTAVHRSGYQRRAAKNKRLYGTTLTPSQIEGVRIRQKRGLARLRGQALELYGGECECCGESNPNYLTFDHINGDGGRLWARLGGGGSRYRVVIKAGYPNSRYRLLCYNCNIALGIYGHCPHVSHGYRSVAVREGDRIAERELKEEMIVAYGGKCQSCGEDHLEFMTIDHVRGGGCQHRREIRAAGVNFYRRLKRQGWPKGDYRLLCFNCNCAKGTVGK
ncbi:hypothetical protein LCGC14_0411930 [marine sediment metagenome]|uniref:Uncharacterized protein n=1 Tax=marine sediment metagenome TaxID=412755 RepID=A0A0F9VFM6_9ZZZZ